MSVHPLRREQCGGPDGKEILSTKQEAKNELAAFRRRHGRGKIQRCAWGGDHWHLTRDYRGRKGTKDKRERR